MKAKIDFKIPQKKGASKSTLNLLQAMLEKEPLKRISSKQALNHECFHTILSVSPLIARKEFSGKSIEKHKNITDKN